VVGSISVAGGIGAYVIRTADCCATPATCGGCDGASRWLALAAHATAAHAQSGTSRNTERIGTVMGHAALRPDFIAHLPAIRLTKSPPGNSDQKLTS
jgi:hypothetical protein